MLLSVSLSIADLHTNTFQYSVFSTSASIIGELRGFQSLEWSFLPLDCRYEESDPWTVDMRRRRAVRAAGHVG